MDQRSRPGPEPTTLEAVGNQWRYALVVVQAGDNDDDESMTEDLPHHHYEINLTCPYPSDAAACQICRSYVIRCTAV